MLFRSFYWTENLVKDQWDRKQTKEFERRISKDSVILKHMDGKEVKIQCADKTDTKSKEINGVGISSAELRISAYQGLKIKLMAGPESFLMLGNSSPDYLNNGFWVQSSLDPVKDPKGTAKLAIDIK